LENGALGDVNHDRGVNFDRRIGCRLNAAVGKGHFVSDIRQRNGIVDNHFNRLGGGLANRDIAGVGRSASADAGDINASVDGCGDVVDGKLIACRGIGNGFIESDQEFQILSRALTDCGGRGRIQAEFHLRSADFNGAAVDGKIRSCTGRCRRCWWERGGSKSVSSIGGCYGNFIPHNRSADVVAEFLG